MPFFCREAAQDEKLAGGWGGGGQAGKGRHPPVLSRPVKDERIIKNERFTPGITGWLDAIGGARWGETPDRPGSSVLQPPEVFSPPGLRTLLLTEGTVP